MTFSAGLKGNYGGNNNYFVFKGSYGPGSNNLVSILSLHCKITVHYITAHDNKDIKERRWDESLEVQL